MVKGYALIEDGKIGQVFLKRKSARLNKMSDQVLRRVEIRILKVKT